MLSKSFSLCKEVTHVAAVCWGRKQRRGHLEIIVSKSCKDLATTADIYPQLRASNPFQDFTLWPDTTEQWYRTRRAAGSSLAKNVFCVHSMHSGARTESAPEDTSY